MSRSTRWARTGLVVMTIAALAVGNPGSAAADGPCVTRDGESPPETWWCVTETVEVPVTPVETVVETVTATFLPTDVTTVTQESTVVVTETLNLDSTINGIETVVEVSDRFVTQRSTETLVQPGPVSNVTSLVPTTVSGGVVEVTRWAAAEINPDTGLIPSITLSAQGLAPGSTVRVTGSGFTPGEVIQVWLHSDPVLLGTATADAQGDFDETFVVPIGTPFGGHSIEVLGVHCKVSAWAPLSIFAPITSTTVADAAQRSVADPLAYTGVRVNDLALWALGLLIGGLLLVTWSRRPVSAPGRHR